MELNRFFDLMEGVRQKAAVEAVFGPPTQVEGKTIIPIGKVAYGYGLGFGQGTTPGSESDEADTPGAAMGAGGGSGGGLKVQPVAVLEVTPETTTLTPIIDDAATTKMVMVTVLWSVFWVARALIKIFGRDR
jgi:uncharacterized spore protein YtfJ